MHVISSPSTISVKLPPADKLDAMESTDDLPPIFIVAMSESKGLADHGMIDINIPSESEDVTVVEGSSVAILEADDSDNAYMAGQSDSDADSENEKVLFQQFLLDHHNTKKAAPKIKAAQEPVHPESKKEKKCPMPKVSASESSHCRPKADLWTRSLLTSWKSAMVSQVFTQSHQSQQSFQSQRPRSVHRHLIMKKGE